MKKMLLILSMIAAALVVQAAQTNEVQAIVTVTYDQEQTLTDFLNARNIGTTNDTPDVRLSAWAHEKVKQLLAEQIVAYNNDIADAATKAFRATLTNNAAAIEVAP